MSGDEDSDPSFGSGSLGRLSVADSTAGDVSPVDALLGEKRGPRVVALKEREQAAVESVTALTEALSHYFLNSERRILNQAERVRAAMRDDLEKQRANVESLVGLFAERLRQEGEDLSTLKRMTDEAHQRLDRHAEAIRSISEGQAHPVELLDEILVVLRRLGAALDTPPTPPTSE